MVPPFDPRAADAAIKAQGRRYAELRDSDADIGILRGVLKDMINETERYISALIEQQGSSTAEPYDVHERRIETLQAKISLYKLQALHLEVEAGSDAENRQRAWREEKKEWERVIEG